MGEAYPPTAADYAQAAADRALREINELKQERAKTRMAKNDGGPAFPAEYIDRTTGNRWPEPGMSLRDYFAGQALQGLIPEIAGNLANEADHRLAPKAMRNGALLSYMIADAMIEARDAGK